MQEPRLARFTPVDPPPPTVGAEPVAKFTPPPDEPNWFEKALAAAVFIAELPSRALNRALLPEPVANLADRASPIMTRVGASVVGGVLGAPGGPAGVAAGGAAGAAAGETLAQFQEMGRGQRSGFNPVQVPVQAALGAIPVVGRAAPSIIKAAVGRAAQGGAIGGVSSALTSVAEGETPTVRSVGAGAALGFVFGAGVGAAEGRVLMQRLAALTGAQRQAEVDRLVSLGVLETVPPPVVETALPSKPASTEFGFERHTRADLPYPYNVVPRSLRPREAATVVESQIPEAIRNPPAPRIPAPSDQQIPGGPVSLGAARPVGEAPPPPRPVVSGGSPAAGGSARYAVDDIDRPRSEAVWPQKPVSPEQMAATQGDSIPAAKPLPADRLVEERMVAHLPEGQRDDVLKIVDEHAGFEAQRRGVQPMARTEALGQYLTAERTRLAPGTTLNAEQTVALNNAVAKVNDDVSALVTKITKGEGTDLDKITLAKLKQDQVVLLANRLGVQAELGRALNAQKIFAEAIASKDDRLLREALQHPEIAQMPDFAKQWAELPDDISKLTFLRDKQKLTWWETFQAVRYGNMLSGVKTHARNLLGTTVNGMFRVASHGPATVYDMGRSAATGAPRTMFFGELKPEAIGAAVGLKRGLDSFLFTMKHGFGKSAVESFDIPRPELPGGVKNPFNVTGRLLEAEDQGMYALFYEMEAAGRNYAKARAEGLKAGLRGKALSDDIQTKMAGWSINPPSDVAGAARQAALETLYREPGGKFVQRLLDLKKNGGGPGKVLDFIIPFAKVPANLLRQSVENVPGGALLTAQGKAALNAGGRESAEAAGRMATGGTMLMAMAYWASQGKVSGSGPTNPQERQALMAQGWRPNSVKLGDAWVDYTIPFQSIATPLFGVANLWERMHETGKAPTASDLAALSFSVANSALDQSFLTGVSDLNSALNDPQRYGLSYLGRQAQTAVIPFTGLSRNITQAVDPVVREPKNVGETLKSVIPGASTSVTPKLDPFGKPIERTGGPLVRGFSPIGVSPVSKDPVVLALKQLGVTLGTPIRTLPKTRTQAAITLTSEERQRVGGAVRAAAEALVKSPGFQRRMVTDEAGATEALTDALDRVRSREYTQIRARRRAGK